MLMFPSGYRRSIKYGQPDASNQIMRTETLNRWDAPEVRYVVTYPEALAEKVATRDKLADHTRRIATGDTIDMTELGRWLLENGFRRTDYVYDVG
ncbi:MAG: hypothetical protein K2M98_03755, partial [Muribaculum sp.]|nr:hypothetical protein [Muribaculum sp.]